MITKNTGSWALITGATSGFGYEFVRILAEKGCNLVIASRNKKNLEKTAKEARDKYGVSVTIFPADLSIPGAAEKLYNQIKKAGIDIDILINNAGIGTFGPYADTDLRAEMELVELNVTSLAYLTKRFLQEMVERNRGKILNVASMASFQPGPYMANYCASKAYVLFLTEGIAQELSGTGVSASALCPGVVLTGFQERAGNTEAKVNKGKHLDAKTVAQIGFDGMMKGKVIIIPGLKTKILVSLNRFVPRSLVRRITAGMIR